MTRAQWINYWRNRSRQPSQYFPMSPPVAPQGPTPAQVMPTSQTVVPTGPVPQVNSGMPLYSPPPATPSLMPWLLVGGAGLAAYFLFFNK